MAVYQRKGHLVGAAGDARTAWLISHDGGLPDMAAAGEKTPAVHGSAMPAALSSRDAPSPAAESRKTVTVLFCDLVGSTAMGEQIDPETLRGLLTRSFDRVSVIVERHGGVVEKFIGDAAMAVFGIPRVHEDDALRAVRAAAEIREALAVAAGSPDQPRWPGGPGSRPARWWRVTRPAVSGWSLVTR